MAELKKGSKKLLNAWAFYDWANSVYNLVIASAVFPIYYQALFNAAEIETVAVFGGNIRSTPLISYTTAAAFGLKGMNILAADTPHVQKPHHTARAKSVIFLNMRGAQPLKC